MTKAFSAPGKALLAGGYLVLDPHYKAYTIALSARIHALVETSRRAPDAPFTVTFKSPQFRESTWVYDTSNGEYLRPCQSPANKSSNPFLYWASLVAVSYALLEFDEFDDDRKTKIFDSNIEITIYSDDSFHTQSTENKSSFRKENSASGKSFYFHNSPISKVPKTGMGSSAALTVSVMTALLSVLLADFPETLDEKTLLLIHNLSQISHCLAQQKIGSGFDVASAVWGSVVYSRFVPTKFDKLFELTQDIDNAYTEFCHEVHLVASSLKVVHDKCSLPPEYTLLMGDVNGGSETPKLVSQVLKWRKEKPERAAEVWTSLNASNMQLIDQLLASDSTVKDLHNTIQNIRQDLRIMSKEADAPIEPHSQTILLDACQSLPGVVGAVVPGAGGYDAICLLIEKAYLDSIPERSANDPILRSVTWLNIHEESTGVHSEPVTDYVSS